MATPGEAPGAGRVAILLSTYNGERFLGGQLASLRAQTVRDWRLYWRDDGSQDATPRLMAEFLPRLARSAPWCCRARAGWVRARVSCGCCAPPAPTVTTSSRSADQDDVWLPEKLALGIAALQARQRARRRCIVRGRCWWTRELRRIAVSPPMRRVPRFPAALTQNIATGCTLMLNRAAVELVAASRAPQATLHDWWCYLLVSAAGGGCCSTRPRWCCTASMTATWWARPRRSGKEAARRCGAGRIHSHVLRQNVAALAEQPQLISAAAREQVAAIVDALDGGAMRRLSVLRMPGLRRQTWSETMVFRLWFVLA